MQLFDVALPHGITLSCRANRAWAEPSDAPRVMFLHGFPEGAFVWDEVIGLLGTQAQCLAPNLRGFERSSAPTDVAAYRAKHLVQDIAALVQAWGGAPIDLLVAHDWGGAVAWAVAAQAPHLIKQLLIINSPHPATFLRELKTNPAQQAASAYMNFLCRPDAAALLSANDYERMWPFFHKMGEAIWLDDAARAGYRSVWDQGMDGGLNYYRASPLKPALDDTSALHKVQLNPDDVTSKVPTTVLWGELDIALLPALLDGLEAYVPQMTLQRVADASHWIAHEKPALVADTVAATLARAQART